MPLNDVQVVRWLDDDEQAMFGTGAAIDQVLRSLAHNRARLVSMYAHHGRYTLPGDFFDDVPGQHPPHLSSGGQLVIVAVGTAPEDVRRGADFTFHLLMDNPATRYRFVGANDGCDWNEVQHSARKDGVTTVCLYMGLATNKPDGGNTYYLRDRAAMYGAHTIFAVLPAAPPKAVILPIKDRGRSTSPFMFDRRKFIPDALVPSSVPEIMEAAVADLRRRDAGKPRPPCSCDVCSGPG